MNTPAEQQYIRKNTNQWDRISMNIIYVTVFSGIGLVALALGMAWFYDREVEITVRFLYWWLPLAVVSVFLNVRGARKINRLLNEFRSKK